MKYFEIVEAPEHKYAPRVKNWYGKIDVRDICIKKYPDLPKRELFVIESSEKTILDFLIFKSPASLVTSIPFLYNLIFSLLISKPIV